MREHDSDYFENTRQATYVHQEYARRNPLEFAGYGEYCWGITATDGPGWETRRVNGIERQFFGYHARGAPYGPDDGTLAPWVAVASLPFAPEIENYRTGLIWEIMRRCPYVKVGLRRAGFRGSWL